ncbi:MAG TPA: hypothetical protein VK498_05100, partial [Ferruginibacter sp.]|nr:hypothetical protein [Ferruginibacter sp.]
MIKKIIIGILKKLGFVIKVTRLSVTEKYKINSDKQGLNLYDTPTGKFYLPSSLRNDIVANTIKTGHVFDAEIIEV